MPGPFRRRLARLALLALAWCLLTGGVFSGCRGLFTPAIPEPPTDPPIVPNYRDPESTLNTMVLAMRAKGRGASAWLGAFADSIHPSDGPAYHQFFDPADLAVFGSVCACQLPTDWRVSQEQSFYFAFLDLRPGEEYVAVFEALDEHPDPQPTESKASLYRRYSVFAQATDQSVILIATGHADLTFNRFSDNWLITRWNDIVDPEVGPNPSDPYQLSLGRRRLESTR